MICCGILERGNRCFALFATAALAWEFGSGKCVFANIRLYLIPLRATSNCKVW